ncbi:MAG: hypothetical protein IJ664_01030 [Clostridia bacterium]|nr:hypothetical protein [Clostridia bacterium]
MKKIVAVLLLLMLVTAALCAQAEGVKRVYRAGEREDFGEDEATFQLHVCPLLGADCMILQCGGLNMLCDMGKANDYPVIKEQLEQYGIPHDFATWGPIHLETNGQYWLVDQELNEAGQQMTVKTGRITE